MIPDTSYKKYIHEPNKAATLSDINYILMSTYRHNHTDIHIPNPYTNFILIYFAIHFFFLNTIIISCVPIQVKKR